MSKGWEGMEKLIQIPEQAGEGSNLGSQMWLYRDDRSHKWSVTARRKMSMSSGKQGKKPWHKDDQNVKTCWFFATLWRKLNSYHFMLTAIFTDFQLSSENILQKRAGWLSLTSQCLYWRLSIPLRVILSFLKLWIGVNLFVQGLSTFQAPPVLSPTQRQTKAEVPNSIKCSATAFHTPVLDNWILAT